jgi:hypothetical protein
LIRRPLVRVLLQASTAEGHQGAATSRALCFESDVYCLWLLSAFVECGLCSVRSLLSAIFVECDQSQSRNLSSQYTGAQHVRLLALGLALWIISLTGVNAETPDNLEQTCEPIKAEIHDCKCTAQFLERHLGSRLGLVLLKVWAAGEGKNPRETFATIYRENDASTVLSASAAFLKVRSEFQVECKPSYSMFSEDQPILVMTDPWSNF